MRTKYLLYLFLICTGFSKAVEDDFIVRLRGNVEAYSKKYSPVSLQLHFNQPAYAAGDTMLFSSTYVKAGTMEGVSGKQLTELFLYNEEGNATLHEKYLIQDGFSSHRLALPKDLPRGIYKLVAYTPWMKNFSPQLFFQQYLKIAGPQALTPLSSDFAVEVFPEGGSWIAGVRNHVVFRIPSPMAPTRAVVKRDGTEIATLLFDALGYASARIPAQPAEGAWSLEATLRGERKTVSLAPPSAEGFALHVDRKGGYRADIAFSKNLRAASNKFYLTVCSPVALTFYRQIDLASDSASLVIPEQYVSRLAVVSVIGDDGKVWANRVLRPSSADGNCTVDLRSRQEAYTVRTPVKDVIVLKDKEGREVSGKMSIRVYNGDLFPEADDTQPNVDMKDITLQSGWLDWAKIIPGTIPEPAYRPQHNLMISGKALKAGTQEPVRDSTLVMFFLQKEIFGYQVYTKNGVFEVPLWFDLFADDEIFYSASFRGRDVANVALQFNEEAATGLSFRGITAREERAADPYGNYATTKKVIDQSFSYFLTPPAKTVADPNFLYEDELGGADVTVTLKDYVVFPTMQDVIREILRAVEYRKLGGQDVMRVYTTHKRPVNFAQPVYIIDGILTKNTTAFMNLNPSDVLTIKVIKDGNKLARLGALFDNGVILVRTKNPWEQKIVQENTFPIKGLLRSYKQKPGTVKQRTVPDLRACLYWDPSAMFDAGRENSLEFLTSDDIGNFLIEVQGITTEGKTFEAKDSLRIRLAPH